MRQQRTQAVILSLLISGSDAFMAPGFSRPQTSLNLQPGQGNQLKAAFDASTCKREGTTAATQQLVEEEHRGPAAAARALVSRIFSLPSAMFIPHPESEDFPMFSRKNEEKDVVLYPIVGFKFFQHGDSYVALPTTSHAACRLVRNTDEDLVGWFSPSCRLDEFSEDPCHSPEMN